MSARAPALEVRDLRFHWDGAPDLLAIDALHLPAAGSLFLYGPSGCGKSTMLGLISGVLAVRSGELRVLGEPLHRMSGAQRDRLRGERMGYVFQQFNLLPYLSVADNVEMPGRLFAMRRRAALDRSGSLGQEASRLAQSLGLDDALLRMPAHRLSVGQQQRVAVARALFGAPELVIADEPTSALDAARRAEFIELLRGESARTGAALVMVSHDLQLAHGFDCCVSLQAINRSGCGAAEPEDPGLHAGSKDSGERA